MGSSSSINEVSKCGQKVLQHKSHQIHFRSSATSHTDLEQQTTTRAGTWTICLTWARVRKSKKCRACRHRLSFKHEFLLKADQFRETNFHDQNLHTKSPARGPNVKVSWCCSKVLRGEVSRLKFPVSAVAGGSHSYALWVNR
jgi:hypothetical protein